MIITYLWTGHIYQTELKLHDYNIFMGRIYTNRN
jgi:hypothetical protein